MLACTGLVSAGVDLEGRSKITCWKQERKPPTEVGFVSLERKMCGQYICFNARYRHSSGSSFASSYSFSISPSLSFRFDRPRFDPSSLLLPSLKHIGASLTVPDSMIGFCSESLSALLVISCTWWYWSLPTYLPEPISLARWKFVRHILPVLISLLHGCPQIAGLSSVC